MSDKHLKLSPHRIAHDQTAWWYEQPSGIRVVQEYHTQFGELIGTRTVVIPWRAIRGALIRKDKP